MRIIYFFFILVLRRNTVHAAVDTVFGQVSPSCSEGNGVVRSIQTLPSPPQSSPFEIPCGQRVYIPSGSTFKFPNGLVVKGELMIQDGSPSSITNIDASYILVQGHLIIGTSAKPFHSKLIITLTDGGKDLQVINTSGNKKFGDKLNFGRKAFVTYGGSIKIFGMKTDPTFTRLAESAPAGSSSIVLTNDVSGKFLPGETVALAPVRFGFDSDLSEYFVIKAVSPLPGGKSQITLNGSLRETRSIRTVKLTDKSKRTVTLSPEVVKLSRNIKIQGFPSSFDLDQWLDSKSVNPLGGHFVIAHSAEPQVVRGVELTGMGQAGISGRYPLHIHFAGSSGKLSDFSHNSIHHSQQRCVVIHATDDLKVYNNVAYRTAGHCYMTEDGIEKGNKFYNNVGIATRNEIKKLEGQSDITGATFWMASPANDMYDNVAAGGPRFGFWFESLDKVRGISRKVQLPKADTIDPSRTNFGKFERNTAHSMHTALATYDPPNEPPKRAVLSDFFGWTTTIGWQMNDGNNQVLKKSLFVDILDIGVRTTQIEGIWIEDTTFVGELFSRTGCDRHPAIGIGFESGVDFVRYYVGLPANKLKNVHFQGYSSKQVCHKTVAIQFLYVEGWFPSASQLQKVTFDEVDVKISTVTHTTNHRQVAFMMKKTNLGSFTAKGYFVSDGFEGESVLTTGCKKNVLPDAKDLFYCKKGCWRHVSVGYKDIDGYAPTKVRFSNKKLGGSWDETPETVAEFVDGNQYDRLVTKIMPKGKYNMELIGSNGKPIPKNLYSAETMFLYKPDEREAKAACKKSVELSVHNKKVVKLG